VILDGGIRKAPGLPADHKISSAPVPTDLGVGLESHGQR
jgi:hypothetical protein